MANYIEVTTEYGIKTTINTEYIIMVKERADKMCNVHLLGMSDSNYLTIDMEYETFKRKIQTDKDRWL